MHAPHHFIHLSALTRSDGLAIGCLLALMWQNQQWQSTLKKYALLGLVITPLLILAYLALSNADSESAATLCVGIPLSNTFAAAMLIFLAGVKSIQVPLITPALSFVGKLSYSGYLLHGIVFQILLHYKLFPFQAFDGIPFYWVVVQPLLTGTVVVLTFFLSWLFWITFEHRFLLLKAKFEG